MPKADGTVPCLPAEHTHWWRADVQKIYNESFPPAEMMPAELLASALRLGRLHLHVTWASEKAACVSVHCLLAPDTAYLLFLATDREMRSQGTGARHMQKLRQAIAAELGANCIIAFEIESTRPADVRGLTTADRLLRSARKRFYERLGAHTYRQYYEMLSFIEGQPGMPAELMWFGPSLNSPGVRQIVDRIYNSGLFPQEQSRCGGKTENQRRNHMPVRIELGEGEGRRPGMRVPAAFVLKNITQFAAWLLEDPEHGILRLVADPAVNEAIAAVAAYIRHDDHARDNQETFMALNTQLMTSQMAAVVKASVTTRMRDAASLVGTGEYQPLVDEAISDGLRADVATQLLAAVGRSISAVLKEEENGGTDFQSVRDAIGFAMDAAATARQLGREEAHNAQGDARSSISGNDAVVARFLLLAQQVRQYLQQ
jgi:hypothetical protein